MRKSPQLLKLMGAYIQFTRMPFGLTNAVAAFQRTMNDLISTNKLIGVNAYLDDITVSGKDTADHDKNLSHFLEVIKTVNITLNKRQVLLAQRRNSSPRISDRKWRYQARP